MRQERRARLVRAARACALASAALACQARPDPRPDPIAVDERATPGPPPAPAAPAGPPPIPPVAAPPPTFSLALLRDGPLHLRSVGDRALVLFDGEAVPLGPDGLARPSAVTALDATGSHGEPLAYAETPAGEAWLVTGRINPRAGGLRDVAVHHHLAGRWTARPTGGEPGLLTYYSPLLVRGETVLGLHAAAIDGDLEDDTAAAAALARSPRGFVRLSGPADDIVPALPEAWTVGDVAISSDGTIYGLAHRDDTATTAVLAWSRDRSEPATIAVPRELPDDARLTVTGRCLLLAGSPRYLLVGRGGAQERGDAWQRITVDLSESDDLGDDPGPALCTDTGELWLTLTKKQGEFGPQRRLLHRSVGGAWHSITLPPPDEQLAPERTWLFDAGGWVEARPEPDHTEPPSIEALAWTGQRLWVLADFGRLVDVGSDNWLPDDRKALYVGGALAGPPTLLPGRWQRALEHALRDRRAPGDCSPFTIALGTTALNDRQRAALRALATTGDDGGVDLLYLGEQGGRRELVVQASAYDRASAGTLARKVGTAVGARVKADCRARRLIEAIEVVRDG